MAYQTLRAVLQKRWFLVALVAIIGGGIFVGPRLTEVAAARIPLFIPTRVATATVLFLMAFSLDSRHLAAAVRAPGPVLWASLLNMGLLPALAIALMTIQTIPDFRIGILIAGSVPCTLATASVWTRKARGNDAVALLVTLLTNGLCFLLTPWWLNTAMSGTSIQLDAGDMVADLAVVVLLPTLAGQLLRLGPKAAAFSCRHKIAIGVVAQVLILAMIFRASCDAGRRIGEFGSALGWIALLIIWGSCLLVHLTGMGVGIAGARRFGFTAADRSAIAFAASQKTLPIGILLATDRSMFGNPNLLEDGLGVPFAVFPILIYHVSQLFIDTLVADRFATQAVQKNSVSQ